MIEIHLLEKLAAFAQVGTLSACAEKLHTSQPTLSRSMRQLEEELGVTLFERRKNQLTLNETGLKAAEYAALVLASDADFEAKVKAYDRSLHTLSIGFCAPVPQRVFTPIISNLFSDRTISVDMTEDSRFEELLKDGTYHLAVLHYEPENKNLFYAKKCGSEQLYISLTPGNPLSFYPQLHLGALDGLSILLLSRIGFWATVHREKTPNSKYLLQIEEESFQELAKNSEYPIFSSSYFISRNQTFPGRVNIPLSDPECRTDYYLVCLKKDRQKYEKLFRRVREDTIV